MRVFLLLLAIATSPAHAITLAELTARLDADVAQGRPLIAHVVVALCDNEFQGIVPVPAKLGNGSDAGSNLYWGAMYGVRGYFRRSAEWRPVAISKSSDPRVLERVLYRREVMRGGKPVEVFLLAEAWNGRNIADAIGHFLELNRGQHEEIIRIGEGSFAVGGAAHLIAFIGHNGLMDFEVPRVAAATPKQAPRASMVLACFSDSYFSSLLLTHSVPLLLTTGLMAPEAYTLDAVVVAWFGGEDADAVREAAGRAYARYQKIPERSARRLFLTHAGNH